MKKIFDSGKGSQGCCENFYCANILTRNNETISASARGSYGYGLRQYIDAERDFLNPKNKESNIEQAASSSCRTQSLRQNSAAHTFFHKCSHTRGVRQKAAAHRTCVRIVSHIRLFCKCGHTQSLRQNSAACTTLATNEATRRACVRMLPHVRFASLSCPFLLQHGTEAAG